MATLAWSFATLELRYQPLVNAIASKSRPKVSAFAPQGLASTGWSFAVLMVVGEEVMLEAAVAVTEEAAVFGPPTLSTTSWAFASLRVVDFPFMDAIAAAAIPRRSWHFEVQQIANLAWSCAVLANHTCPLLKSISEAARKSLSAMTAPAAHSLLWSLWACDQPVRLEQVLLGWLQGDTDLSDLSNAVGIVLLDAEGRRDNIVEQTWLPAVVPPGASLIVRKTVAK